MWQLGDIGTTTGNVQLCTIGVMPSRNWSKREVEAAVQDYLSMLTCELRGEKYNKADHNRQLRTRLDDRTHGSVERKHQNISAVLIGMGFPPINGYKPLGNVQGALRDAVREQMSPSLVRLVASDVAAPQPPTPVHDILSVLVDAPERNPISVREKPPEDVASGRHRQPPNYLQQEALNQSLGDAGEAMVMEYETTRLRKAGKDRLAGNVEQVSKTIGDHAGYDIHSYEVTGHDRFVEVKTTRYSKRTPFFISAGEIQFSKANRYAYQLYRVFQFRERPQLFTLPGDVATHVRLEAMNYRARF